jgi:hypothetical protein
MFCGLTSKLNFVYKRVNAMFIIIFWNFRYFRLYAPGETVNYNFKIVPAVHNFPSTDMTHATMRVSVASLPRPQNIPDITCVNCSKGRQQKQDKFMKGRSAHREQTSQPLERPSKSLGLDQYSLKSLESHQRRKKSDQSDGKKSVGGKLGNQKSDQSEDSLCLPSRPKSPKVSDEDDGCESRKEIGSVSNKGKSLLVKKSLYHKPPTGRKCKTDEDEQVCDKNDDSILPETMVTDLKKEKLIVTNNSMHANCSGASNTQFSPHHCYAKNLLKETFKEKPLSFTQQETHSKHFVDPDTLIKRLPSPKVLFTTNTKSQSTTYKKRRLDLSDLSEQVEDKIMYSDLQDLMKPLHSDELDSYLSSLSNRVPVLHDSIDTIPLTKCNFFIGEKSNEIDVSNMDLIEDGQQRETTDVNTREVTDISSTTFHKPFERKYDETQKSDNLSKNVTLEFLNNERDKKNSHELEDKCEKPISETRSRDSVTKCLFKSLSEPGPGVDKCSMSLFSENYRSSATSHDGSPNGLSFTDDESSDNSTPTNSLSEHNGILSLANKQNTQHAFNLSNDEKSTSNKGRELDVNNSLENEIAKLQITDESKMEDTMTPGKSLCKNSVQNIQNNPVIEKKKEDKMALGKSLCKHLMTKELKKIGRVSSTTKC